MAGIRLNEYGEDHVRKIAENLRNGAMFPVVVERSQTSPRPGTKYKYPVHFNPDLDMKRREVVVRALTRMGIADADTRVVVAPAFAQPLTGKKRTGLRHRSLGRRHGRRLGWRHGRLGGGMGGGWF